MRNIIIITIVSFFGGTSNFGTTSFEDFNKAFIDAASKNSKSVVNIITYKIESEKKPHLTAKTGYGSGTILTKSGYIITNYHVVKKGNYYQIILADGTETEPLKLHNEKYYFADEKTDLAVMKINGEMFNLHPAQFGDSDTLVPGQWVIAIGNPYGLRQSITAGIISATGRSDVGFADIEDFIQTDVPINPGNSGGPLIDLSGKVIGINTAIRTGSGGYQGISFAIPSNIVIRSCQDLIRHGRVKRGWLGFLVREKRRDLTGEKKTVEIVSVIKGSPAHAAGLEAGDQIREVDGKEISSLGSLIKIINNTPIGTTFKLTIAREGHLMDVLMKLREKTMYKKIRNQINELYDRYGIELDENALTGEIFFSYVSPLQAGYYKGLKKGDVVLSLNGKKINSLEGFLNTFEMSGRIINKINILRGNTRFEVEFTRRSEQEMQ
ncbi:MAG: trypsin-like peptidase domain-containing protein [Spirochaetes bacterium]|nr:trypsin-like peptidase domain-containing protein [Spirochaetota bacterium]